MAYAEKIFFLLVVIGAFCNVSAYSARGLQSGQLVQPVYSVQPVEPVQHVQNGDPNNGFALQSGYEGYLLSPQKASNAISAASEIWNALAKIGLLKSPKSLLVPLSTFMFLHGVKIFKELIRIVGLLAFGTLLAIPICTYTSLCSISFDNSPFSFIKPNAVKEQVKEFARYYMTPEKLEIASRLVQSALETYGTTAQKFKNQQSEAATAGSPVSSEQPNEEQNETHVD